MVDKFTDPLLTPHDIARHLLIPPATVYYWLNEKADGEPLVHGVRPEKRGWPSAPFIAVVEAYVLRSLRDLGLTKQKIRAAATTDGIDIFVHYADDDIVRVGDNQRPIREVISNYLEYIKWDTVDSFPARLRLSSTRTSRRSSSTPVSVGGAGA